MKHEQKFNPLQGLKKIPHLALIHNSLFFLP